MLQTMAYGGSLGTTLFENVRSILMPTWFWIFIRSRADFSQTIGSRILAVPTPTVRLQ